MLVQHSQKSGRLLGCICIVPPYPSWWLLKGHYKRTLRCLATDAFKHSGKDSRYARYQSYIMDTMESKQKAISGFDVPDYWQIIHLSVTRQRMGCGSNLVKAAQQLIATYEEERINNIQSQRNENMRSLIMKLRNKETKTSSNSQLNIVRPIYLESDSIAVNFYQKMGFQLIGHRPIAEELQETMIMRDYDVETASAVQEGQYPILHGMLYDYNV